MTKRSSQTGKFSLDTSACCSFPSSKGKAGLSGIDAFGKTKSKTEDFPMKTDFLIRRSIPLAVLTGFLVLGAGCKNPFVPEQPAPAAQQAAPAAAPQPAPPAPRNDQQIGSDIQAKIGAESALNGQNIQVNVANGVATLDGKVDNDASRALAAADSATVDGVRTVVNNLVVAPAAGSEGGCRSRAAQGSGPGGAPTPSASAGGACLPRNRCKSCLRRHHRLRLPLWPGR